MTALNEDITLEELFVAVQKEKVELFTLSLHALIDKHRDELTLENKAASFIAIFAHLIYLKSVRLLPQEVEESQENNEIAFMPNAEEYCSFRQVAATFSTKEREQTAHFLRSLSLPQEPVIRQAPEIPLNIEEFSRLFSQVWQQAQERYSTIVEEEWRVADALDELRYALATQRLLFNDLFSPTYSKDRLIVTFLAILELMKNQEAYLVKDLKLGVYLCTAQNRS
jgi:segregation and condensation protein A